MKYFLCLQNYTSVHADSTFYKGSVYTPSIETESKFIFFQEEWMFEFNKNSVFFRHLFVEIKSFKFGR